MNRISRGLRAGLLALAFLAAGAIHSNSLDAQETEATAADLGGGRAVLITGASSGIGLKTAEVLAAIEASPWADRVKMDCYPSPAGSSNLDLGQVEHGHQPRLGGRRVNRVPPRDRGSSRRLPRRARPARGARTAADR